MSSDFGNLVYAQRTDRGLKREINEDSCAFHIPEPGTPAAAYGALFIVADGIGGIGGGEEASRAAIDTIMATYYDPDLDDEDPRERIIAAIQDANEAVRARARTLDRQMLGTTLAGAVILADQKSYLFNVGDSRIYRLRGQTIEQMTSDHSSVDTQESYARAKLTAFIGQFQPILPHLITSELQKDDTLLICSDGLWGLVEPPEIAAVVQRYSPQKAVDVLIKMVYERGARDNVTITIIQNGKRANYGLAALATLALLVAVILIGIFAVIQSPSPAATPTVQLVEATANFTVHSSLQPPPVATQSSVATAENPGQLVIRTPTESLNNDKGD